MSATRPLYDLVLMLDTAAEDARRAEILQGAQQAIAAGGTIVNEQDWGARAMAFEIDHKKDAEYHLLQFNGTPELLAQLDRTLRIADEVVRFRIIKLAPGTPDAPEQRAEPRPAGVAAPTSAGVEETQAGGDDAPAAVEAEPDTAASEADAEAVASPEPEPEPAAPAAEPEPAAQ